MGEAAGQAYSIVENLAQARSLRKRIEVAELQRETKDFLLRVLYGTEKFLENLKPVYTIKEELDKRYGELEQLLNRADRELPAAEDLVRELRESLDYAKAELSKMQARAAGITKAIGKAGDAALDQIDKRKTDSLSLLRSLEVATQKIEADRDRVGARGETIMETVRLEAKSIFDKWIGQAKSEMRKELQEILERARRETGVATPELLEKFQASLDKSEELQHQLEQRFVELERTVKGLAPGLEKKKAWQWKIYKR